MDKAEFMKDFTEFFAEMKKEEIESEIKVVAMLTQYTGKT